MGRPSRSTVTSWNLSALRTQATSLIDAATDLRTQTQAVSDAAQNSADKWVGESQRACEQRALSDQAEINKLGADIDRAGNILNNTANAISPNRSTALSRADGLEMDQFQVADDWTVRDTRNYAVAIAAAEPGSDECNQLIAARDRRIIDAINSTLSLQALADQMGVDDQAGATALADAFRNAEINAPITAGMSTQQAVRDAEAITDGTATPQQKARFEAATDLSPEQRDALIQGKDAVIPKGRFEYLRGFYGELNKHGLEGFSSFGGDDPALKAALADGLQLLSNPQVRTDQQIDNWFGPVVSNVTGRPAPPAYIRGGLSQVPSAIRDPLTHQAVRNSETKTTLDRGHVATRDSTAFPTLDKLGTVADILGHGDPDMQLGSDIDRALIVRSSEIAGAAIDPHTNFGDGYDHTTHAEIREVLDKTTSVAGNDHVAVHDALMTGREGGPGTTSAMPDTIDTDGATTGYDAGDAMTSLMSFDWADGTGSEGTGADKLFRWIGDSASAPDGSSPDTVAESWRAGESGGELTRIIAENKDSLVDIAGSAALGEVNPELTRTLADAIAPQIGDLAGAPDGLFTTNGAARLDGADQMSNLFQVLDTDADAGRAFNTAAAQTISYAESAFGHDTSHSNLGAVVGRIEGAMYSGLEAQTTEDRDDNRYAATVDYANKGGLFDSGKAVVGSIPMGAAAKVLMDTAAPWVKLDAIGDPPDVSAIGADESFDLLKKQLDSSTTTTDRYEQILRSYAAENPHILNDPTLSRYFDGDGNVDLRNKDGDLFARDLMEHLGNTLQYFDQSRRNGLELKDWE